MLDMRRERERKGKKLHLDQVLPSHDYTSLLDSSSKEQQQQPEQQPFQLLLLLFQLHLVPFLLSLLLDHPSSQQARRELRARQQVQKRRELLLVLG